MARTLGSPRHALLVELLVRARVAANLTQAEVAKRLRRHQPFVSNIEAGERRLDPIELLEFATVIDLDVHQVVEEFARLPSG